MKASKVSRQTEEYNRAEEEKEREGQKKENI